MQVAPIYGTEVWGGLLGDPQASSFEAVGGQGGPRMSVHIHIHILYIYIHIGVSVPGGDGWGVPGVEAGKRDGSCS